MGYQDISTNETRSNIWPIGTGSNYGPQACRARCAALNATQPANGPFAPNPTQSGAAGGYGASASSTTSGYTYTPSDS